MEHERWVEISAAISQVQQHFCDDPSFEHSTALIVRAHLWAVFNDRSTWWATHPRNWDRQRRPASLPSQPTMSRRLRTTAFNEFMTLMERHLAPLQGMGRLFKRLDGKPLPVAAHSTDRNATWGRGAGQLAKGYKLHAIWSASAMPDQWRVAPLKVSEQEMARRMLRHLPEGGYITADKNYDTNDLFDDAALHHHQLICPRRYGTKCGLGRHRHSSARLQCKDMLEQPSRPLSRFGSALMHHRKQIERDFGNLTSFGGGLNGLPSWARRYWRVKNWVWAKLMINAARIRVLRRKCRNDE